ncbi:MAG: hypothetical protein K0R25_738 [Rickettsiaceae bacterium]|jgi:hypothetical protein|nr:hypothetical protein [Rickettsiaceae bacterium]
MNKNKITGIVFTIIYAIGAGFLSILGSVHGPSLFIYFSAGFLAIAILALWGVYFFVKRRDFRHDFAIFFFGALAIGLILTGTIIASWSPIVDLDIRKSEKRSENTIISNMTDEVLLSDKGNPIGIRLKYSISFPDEDHNWGFPMASPEKNLGVSIWSDMTTVNHHVEPSVMGDKVDKNEQGKVYNFTFDMIPYFVRQDVKKTKKCIDKPSKQYEEAFQKLIQNSELIRFNIRISGANFSGTTANAYDLKEFYDSAIKEGVRDCGAVQR